MTLGADFDASALPPRASTRTTSYFAAQFGHARPRHRASPALWPSGLAHSFDQRFGIPTEMSLAHLDGLAAHQRLQRVWQLTRRGHLPHQLIWG
jgi:hypothetical protein